MFPSVTGKMFPKSICDTDTSAPYNIPCGIKNIFAIECSNPMVTNAVIGQKMAKIFPATLVVAIVPHTAKHTNQLHSTPLTNATITGNVVAFIVAIAIAGAGFAAEVIAMYAMYAKNTDPAKLPAYDTAQFFITCARVTFFDNKPLNITNTFPVNNSAPVNITMVNPNGRPNRPFTRFESPGFAAANAGELPPTVVKNRPPNPMSAPAVKLNANVENTSALAFFSDVATAAWNVSGGVLSDACTMSFEDCVLLPPPARLCRLRVINKLSFATNAFPPMVMEEALVRFEKEERGRLFVVKLPFEKEDDSLNDFFAFANAEKGALVVIAGKVVIVFVLIVNSFRVVLPFNFL